LYIVEDIKKRLVWVWHVAGIHRGRKIFESKSEGGRRMGRTRPRYLEDVEWDHRETKVKNGGRRQYIEESECY
jgi:hypothetical protein